MSAIINIGSTPPSWPVQPSGPQSTGIPAESAPASQSDSVEISRFGQALSSAAEQSSLSLARIQAIRQQIENGTFETATRIDGTASRLVDLLR